MAQRPGHVQPKPVRWVGSSKEDLRQFPEEVRRRVGGALWDAQLGRKAPYVKPLRGFGGASVLEIVDDFDGDTFRAVYTVRRGRLRSACLPKEIQARHRHAESRVEPDRAATQASKRGLPAMVEKRGAEIPVTPGSGNVFADLGFAEPEEELTKAQLARGVRVDAHTPMDRPQLPHPCPA